MNEAEFDSHEFDLIFVSYEINSWFINFDDQKLELFWQTGDNCKESKQSYVDLSLIALF